MKRSVRMGRRWRYDGGMKATVDLVLRGRYGSALFLAVVGVL